MQSKITRLLKNFSNARRSWECWCFMVNFNLDNPNLQIVSVVNANPLLFHLRYLSLKDFYIELYKILKNSKNNSDNIFAQLKELKENNPSKCEAVNMHLKELENQLGTINRICDLRDKFYAHLDKEYEAYIGAISVQDILKCFVTIEQIIITLSSQEVLQKYLDDIPSKNDLKL